MAGEMRESGSETLTVSSSERVDYYVSLKGSFMIPDESWVEELVSVHAIPDEKIHTRISLEIIQSPVVLPEQSAIEDTKNIADNAALIEEITRLDEHKVLETHGYRANAFKSYEFEIYDLTTPTPEQITEDLASVGLPYPIAEIVFNDGDETLENRSRLAIKHGVALQVLAGTHLGEKIRRRAIDVHERQDVKERAEFVKEVKAACSLETVFDSLYVIKNNAGWKNKLAGTRHYEWSEPLKEVINRLTPIISGRRKVGDLSDEERSYILLYLKHVAEFFNIEPADTDQTKPELTLVVSR